jgi:hypothetical protein
VRGRSFRLLLLKSLNLVLELKFLPLEFVNLDVVCRWMVGFG